MTAELDTSKLAQATSADQRSDCTELLHIAAYRPPLGRHPSAHSAAVPLRRSSRDGSTNINAPCNSAALPASIVIPLVAMGDWPAGVVVELEHSGRCWLVLNGIEMCR